MVQVPAEQKSSDGKTGHRENVVQDNKSITKMDQHKLDADKFYIESAGTFENDSFVDSVFREGWIEEKEKLNSNG